MFTGIIQEIGFIKKKKHIHHTAGFSIIISSERLKPRTGDSIAVNGACLTVTEKTFGGFCTDVIPETSHKTNLANLQPGDAVNLEPSLKIGDKLNGHFVTGHIDATCKVKKIKDDELSIELPKELRQFIAKKGSIAVNGVSLTVVNVKKNTFTAALIPYTVKNTNLGKAKNGNFVNIEVDLIARYLLWKVKSQRSKVK